MKFFTKLIIAAFAIFALFGCAKKPAKIVFYAGNSVHYWGDHENEATCILLEKAVNAALPDIKTEILYMQKGATFADIKDATAVIVVAEGGENSPFKGNEAAAEKLAKSGVNFGILHYALQPCKKEGEPFIRNICGGAYETYWSVNPTWKADIVLDKTHPISNGVADFSLVDEWYFNIRLAENAVSVAKAAPPDKVRKGRNGAHSGNDYVRQNLGKSETLLWTYSDSSHRAFGFTGGHSVWALKNDNYRKLLLNAVVWLAKKDLPQNGVESMAPTYAEMESLIAKPPRRDIESYKKLLREKFGE